jgi:hypothetical protein
VVDQQRTRLRSRISLILLQCILVGIGTKRSFARDGDRSKSNEQPTSLGILSRHKILAVAISDAMGGSSDMWKMRQNRQDDP